MATKIGTRYWNALAKHYKQDPDIFLWKIHGGPFSSPAGIPDTGVLCRGRAMFIEFKAKRDRIAPLQHEAMADIATKGGCPSCVCHSTDEAIAAIELWRLGTGPKGLSQAIEVTSGGQWVWPEA